MKNSIESIIARGISIVSKFLLIGYLAKILTLKDYGSFQLISYFIMISTTVFGLEYYNISNRDIAKNGNEKEIYYKHLSFFYTLSPLLLILQVLLFFAILPDELTTFRNIIFVLTIGVCDYLSQEVYRYLMINKAYRKGNIQLIYKSFFFLILIGAYLLFYKTMVFEDVLAIMTASYILLFLFAYYSFTKNLYRFEFNAIKILKWDKIRDILKSTWPFMILIVFIKGIDFFDKFFIGKQLGLEEAGIYSFLFSIATVLNVFVMSGFYIIYLPQLIHSFGNDRMRFRKELVSFSALTIGFSILLAVAIVLVSPFVFDVIGKVELLEHLDLLYILLIGFVLFNISLIPHLLLYIFHDEKNITFIMGGSFIVNLGLNLWLVPKLGINGAGYSFLITYGVVLILKSIKALTKWKKIAV